ncbi:hypothetical protein EG68_11181 [Paragonimus skrjabini miyazakii]|uniref:Uncharacterized protein n=1 Tax=Paragonimus skrjabini miyazakii TaxID=59628 RepID=A0A8S9YHW0_9TREM|nr:hypothetical protein EG68_11181 [Paragonimus skrjabini miyazakii]
MIDGGRTGARHWTVSLTFPEVLQSEPLLLLRAVNRSTVDYFVIKYYFISHCFVFFSQVSVFGIMYRLRAAYSPQISTLCIMNLFLYSLLLRCVIESC